MASLASQVIQYTGGATRLGRRVRLSAVVALLALALRTVVVVGVSGPPHKKKKRSAIQEDLRKVGKAVVGDDAATECQGNFDEYDIVVVGGGMSIAILPRLATRSPRSGRCRDDMI
jgi:hypothetical protein